MTGDEAGGTAEDHEAETETALRQLMKVATTRSTDSLDAARLLHKQGFYDQAFVWAVRAVEIFMREFVLAPIYAETRGWKKGLRKAGKTFGHGRWQPALLEVERLVGPLDEMLTESGENAYRHWEKRIVGQRGDIVHGLHGADATADETSIAIEFAEQLILQIKLRLIVSKTHPLHRVIEGLFTETEARQADELRPRPDGTR